MAMTDSEKLQKIREQQEQIKKKQAQIKAQEQILINRINEKERKERTRRLIQNGALAEKYLNCEGINQEDFKNVLEIIIRIPEVAKYLDNSFSSVEKVNSAN